MASDNILLTIAVVVTVVSVIGLFASFYSLGPGGVQFGPNVTTANVTVSVVQNLAIVFTNNSIDFGTGSVNSSRPNATLNSMGVYDDWINISGNANRTGGFILENVGNVNVTLYLKTNKNASGFIMDLDAVDYGAVAPDDGQNFSYMVKNCVGLPGVTDCRPAANESMYDNAATCGAVAGVTFGSWYDVNTTGVLGTRICNQTGWEEGKDELRIDIQIVIPDSTPLFAKRAMMTATAEAAS